MGATKQQWLDETGGRRLGESEVKFQQRVSRIQEIKGNIKRREASPEMVDELAKLLGTGEDDGSSEWDIH